MRNVTVAATQMACTHNSDENIDKAIGLIKTAKQKGADIILIQEMFASLYFPCINDPENFNLALPYKNNPILEKMAVIAKELMSSYPSVFLKKTTIHTTTHWLLLMPMEASWIYTESLIYLMDQVMKKNIFSIPEIPVSKFGIQNLAELELAFVGINGTQKQQEL